MKVAFSGPREGMSTAQAETLPKVLHQLGCDVFHHGDCQGADHQAHVIARSMGIYIVGHPPTADGLRAFCVCDELREPAPFLTRNHHIVQETGILLATPSGPEHRRSGTWSTIRYARKLHLPYVIINVLGETQAFNTSLT